jgi:hypothetical protein
MNFIMGGGDILLHHYQKIIGVCELLRFYIFNLWIHINYISDKHKNNKKAQK